MTKLLYINACIRKTESRTLTLAAPIIRALSARYDIEEIDLTESALLPLDYHRYNARAAGSQDPLCLDYATRVAQADRIVFAAPFWDMSFPAMLKVFCEQVSLYGITFGGNPDGSTHGLCNAQKMMLITTRGMEIADNSPLDQGSSYLKAIGWLWGIPELEVISAHGMDVCSAAECDRRLQEAAVRGQSIAASF